MSKRNVVRETGINFLIGYGIGRVGRTLYDQNKMKKEKQELEKREAYRQAYGDDAYRKKYELKDEQIVKRVDYKQQYIDMEYNSKKKNPFIALFLSFFTIIFGYLYISPMYMLVAFIVNVITFNLLFNLTGYLSSTELEVITQMIGFVALYLLNVITPPILTIIYNLNMKRKIEGRMVYEKVRN